jgi:predicted DNA-binding transcriptional regulator AlpA
MVLNDSLLDSKEAAKLLGCTEGALALWRRERRGPSFVRLGRLVRYLQGDLIDWVESRKVIQESGTSRS